MTDLTDVQSRHVLLLSIRSFQVKVLSECRIILGRDVFIPLFHDCNASGGHLRRICTRHEAAFADDILPLLRGS